MDSASDKESVLDTISRVSNVHDTLCSDDVKSSVNSLSANKACVNIETFRRIVSLSLTALVTDEQFSPSATFTDVTVDRLPKSRLIVFRSHG